MVWLHVKRGGGGTGEDSSEFLVERACADTVADVCGDVTNLYNQLVTLQFVCANARSLAQYGPMLSEHLRGLDDVDDEKAECPDPNKIRNGYPPHPNCAAALIKSAVDAESVISKDRILMKEPLTFDALNECELLIKGAIIMSFPMGLPEWDVLNHWANDKLDFAGTHMEKKILGPGEACLWFAGKKWCTNESIAKYVGCNEKTKVIVRLQRVSSGAPVREPGVDRDTQKKMMSYYHKRQEEDKRLKEDSSDSYLNSKWSNPRQMKEQFQGVGNIKWR